MSIKHNRSQDSLEKGDDISFYHDLDALESHCSYQHFNRFSLAKKNYSKIYGLASIQALSGKNIQ